MSVNSITYLGFVLIDIFNAYHPDLVIADKNIEDTLNIFLTMYLTMN